MKEIGKWRQGYPRAQIESFGKTVNSTNRLLRLITKHRFTSGLKDNDDLRKGKKIGIFGLSRLKFYRYCFAGYKT